MRDDTPAAGRIDDLEPLATNAFEDHEVVEAPVEDRTPVERREVLDLFDAHRTSPETEPFRSLEEASYVGPPAADADDPPHLFEREPLAEARQHHREARRATVAVRGLRYVRGPLAEPQLPERRARPEGEGAPANHRGHD